MTFWEFVLGINVALFIFAMLVAIIKALFDKKD